MSAERYISEEQQFRDIFETFVSKGAFAGNRLLFVLSQNQRERYFRWWDRTKTPLLEQLVEHGMRKPAEDPTAGWYSVYRGVGGGRWKEVALCEFRVHAEQLMNSWPTGKVKLGDEEIAINNPEGNNL